MAASLEEAEAKLATTVTQRETAEQNAAAAQDHAAAASAKIAELEATSAELTAARAAQLGAEEKLAAAAFTHQTEIAQASLPNLIR